MTKNGEKPEFNLESWSFFSSLYQRELPTAARCVCLCSCKRQEGVTADDMSGKYHYATQC